MHNIQIEQLASGINTGIDTDITQLFKPFRQLTGAILLDSTQSQHQDARFDIFVADPIATIAIEQERCQIDSQYLLPDVETLTVIDKITAIQNKLFENTLNSDSHLPFIIGAMGYFGYDWGKGLEKVDNESANEYQTPELQVGIYSWSVIKDKANRAFYFCYHPSYPHPDKAYLESLFNIEQQEEHAEPFTLQKEWQSNLSKEEYISCLNRIHEYLLAGDCYQINMAQRFASEYSGDEWTAYEMLRNANSAPFSAYVNTQLGAILSISPERFLAVKDNIVETKPIKGTRPRMTDAQNDLEMAKELQSSAKDRAENLMIVDLLRNDLSKNCQPGSVNVPKLFDIESFPAVHHLVSTVTGKLKSDCSPLRLLQDAFPGGSITGAPKIRAMQIIEELEPNHRHIYCGSIGYLGINQDMDSNICIRTLLLENNNIYCWAGGGIVADSKPELEYQETLDKVAKILPLLATQQKQ